MPTAATSRPPASRSHWLGRALGYKFENGFGLMALWNKQKVEQSDKSDYDSIDYYTLGAQYKVQQEPARHRRVPHQQPRQQ